MLTITDNEFARLTEYMKTTYGIQVKPEKKSLVIGRLQSIISQEHYLTFTNYFDHVLADKSGESAVTLINRLTTNHTFFLRERKHFDFFRDSVLPYLASTQAVQKDLKIWSAGCSTGEEPYTLAMVIADYFGISKGLWNTCILATDISTRVLEKAATGKYDTEDLAMLPEIWKKRYFRKLDDQSYSISDKIRNDVIFRRLNLNSSAFPFKKKLHVIFCRNVMIYFEDKAKKELIDRFYDLLEPGGYLFIGHSESINRADSKFRYVIPAVYRKIN